MQVRASLRQPQTSLVRASQLKNSESSLACIRAHTLRLVLSSIITYQSEARKSVGSSHNNSSEYQYSTLKWKTFRRAVSISWGFHSFWHYDFIYIYMHTHFNIQIFSPCIHICIYISKGLCEYISQRYRYSLLLINDYWSNPLLFLRQYDSGS